MLIITLHRWAGIYTQRGLWTARTLGFVTIERLPGDSKLALADVLNAMRRRRT